MAFDPIPNAAQVRMQYLMPNGRQAVNVLGLTGVAPWDEGDLGSAIGFFASWWAGGGDYGDGIAGTMSTETRLQRITATSLEAADAPQVTTDVGAAGTVAGQPLPASTTVLIDWSAGLRGGSYRGHTALPAPAETVSDPDGNLVAGALADFSDPTDQLIEDLTTLAVTGGLAVISRKLSVATKVVGFSVNTKFGVDRSRQDR